MELAGVWLFVAFMVFALVLALLDKRTVCKYSGEGEVLDLLDLDKYENSPGMVQVRVKVEHGGIRTFDVHKETAKCLYPGAIVSLYWRYSRVWATPRGYTMECITG